MDSDHSSSSSSSVATKICYCQCWRRMSTLTYDFHSVFIKCRGIDCDFENNCNECADISDDVMTSYVKHHKQLKAKQRYKSKSKDPLLSASAIDDPAIISDAPSSVDVRRFRLVCRQLMILMIKLMVNHR